MVQAYNFLASWQLFPEKCVFENGLAPKSGNYKIESIEKGRIKINDLYITHKISGDQLIILNSEIQSFTDICGACERIKNTPIHQVSSTFRTLRE